MCPVLKARRTASRHTPILYDKRSFIWILQPDGLPTEAAAAGDNTMKRILVLVVLAALLISAVGVTTAAAEKPTTITRRVCGSDTLAGTFVGPAVGIVTFNTTDGRWTITTYGPLPSADGNLYQLAITTSAPHGRWATDSISLTAPIIESVDGRIETSGQIDPAKLSEVNQCIADGGVFLLWPNDV